MTAIPTRASSATRKSDLDAAAQAAGRGLFTGALQSNPIVALGALLLSPILGLFKRRAVATNHVSKLKLETYRSTPVSNPHVPKLRGNGGPMEDEWSYNGATMVRPPRSPRVLRAKSSRSAVKKGGV